MKKLIIHIVSVVLILFAIISCGNTRRLQSKNDNIYGGMRATEEIMTRSQLDSMCVADTLAVINEWFANKYVDYETGQTYLKYTYAKIYSDDFEIIYIVMPKGELYKITKRTVTE